MSRNTPEKPQKPVSQPDGRTKKLADALRANLKRRKAVERTEGVDSAGKSGSAED
jgi:hypothetical protein